MKQIILLPVFGVLGLVVANMTPGQSPNLSDSKFNRSNSNSMNQTNTDSSDTIVVTSARNNFRADDGELASGDGWKVTKKTLRGGVQEGVEVITVDNGKLQFTVIPTRGMSVHKVTSGDMELGWNSPVKQIVHPNHVDLQDHGGLGWLTGFNEFMVRCGLEFAGHPGEDDGRMLTLHGRVGNIPASEVEVVVDSDEPNTIRIRGLVEERMFKFGLFELWTEVSTVPGSNSIRFQDRLVNKSEYEKEYQIIYHANYGRPLLEEGAQFSAPIKELYPFDNYAAKDLATYQTYLGPTPNYGEQVYGMKMNYDDKGMTVVMLANKAGTNGVEMKYSVESLPWFNLWKNTDTETDGYVTGLEPATGMPYNRSIEREFNRVPKLGPGEEKTFTVEVTVLPTDADVAATKKKIDEIQNDRATKVHFASPNEPDQPDQITVQHILIGFEGSIPGKEISRTQAEAKNLALTLLAKISKGEDFDELVKEYTDDAHPGIYQMANFGLAGDMEPEAVEEKVFPRAQMVGAFGDVGFPLKVNEVGVAHYDPETSKYGWHIIKRIK